MGGGCVGFYVFCFVTVECTSLSLIRRRRRQHGTYRTVPGGWGNNFCELQGKPPDWQDFVGIITLLIINSTISFIEENNAGNAAAALMARLAPKAKVVIGPVNATMPTNC